MKADGVCVCVCVCVYVCVCRRLECEKAMYSRGMYLMIMKADGVCAFIIIKYITQEYIT